VLEMPAPPTPQKRAVADVPFLAVPR
jgi:hypothetical protein